LFNFFNTTIFSIDSRFTFSKNTSKLAIDFREKFIKKVDHIKYANESFHLAGGNYSFLFLLPAMIKVIKKSYPFLSVNIVLYETRDDKDYINCNHQCVFSASYDRYYSFSKYSKNMKIVGYNAIRGVIKDSSYFYASKEAVEQFGSKHECLKKMDYCYGRIFKNSLSKEEISFSYNTTPSERQDAPRLISDMLFLSYLFAKYSAGIWINWVSSLYEKNIVNLNKIADFDRIFLYKSKAKEVALKIKKGMKNLVCKKFFMYKQNLKNTNPKERKKL